VTGASHGLPPWAWQNNINTSITAQTLQAEVSVQHTFLSPMQYYLLTGSLQSRNSKNAGWANANFPKVGLSCTEFKISNRVLDFILQAVCQMKKRL